MIRPDIEQLAIRCALGNNGGEWSTHYTEDQKNHWRQFVMDLMASAFDIERAKWMNQEYQPIATAPKDGTPIVAFCPDSDDGIGMFYEATWLAEKNDWDTHIMDWGLICPFSHWVPKDGKT